jgi:hypothetical protein
LLFYSSEGSDAGLPSCQLLVERPQEILVIRGPERSMASSPSPPTILKVRKRRQQPQLRFLDRGFGKPAQTVNSTVTGLTRAKFQTSRSPATSPRVRGGKAAQAKGRPKKVH